MTMEIVCCGVFARCVKVWFLCLFVCFFFCFIDLLFVCLFVALICFVLVCMVFGF